MRISDWSSDVCSSDLLASRNITVNCVAPGFIHSAMTDVLPDAQKDALLQKIPAGKLGEGQDIAAAVAFLASAEAAYITGLTLHVNGGRARTQPACTDCTHRIGLGLAAAGGRSGGGPRNNLQKKGR